MKGLPTSWMHTKDELYARLRGPAENMTVLATALSGLKDNSESATSDSERHEPILMSINYGQGRVFHTVLGHMDYSVSSVGFIATLQRGAEWAATGKVTQAVPSDFPSATESSSRKWGK
jgi:type 1 glutamine amidotransferase